MGEFKPSNYKAYIKHQAKVTNDVLYWKKLGVPVIFKEFGPIDYIDFSPVEPYCFAVTCSVRVQLFNPILKQATRNFSRFGKAAHGATFRSDGHLLVVGDDDCNIKLFDVNTKSLLRVFKGHTGAVHRNFFTTDKTHIASFSDDKSVMVWDIPTEKIVDTYREHNDYVRAGATSPISPDIVLSGSYDQTVKLYDSRMGQATMSVEHGSPVESVLFLPSGGIFISSGGTHVKIWDALAGGRLLGKLSQHHKTITCLRLAENGRCLLSGSLDRHIKIYNISNFQVVHTLDYPSPILSVGISDNDDTLAVGFTDGLISMVRRETESRPSARERKKAVFRYIPQDFRPEAVDVLVKEETGKFLAKHDRLLRVFEYSKALDCAMRRYIINRRPAVTVGILQELIRRKGLVKALAGRDSKFLVRVVKFIMKNIGDYRFTKVLLDTSGVLLDIYGDSVNQSPEIALVLQYLRDCLKEEEEITYRMLALQGAVEMFMAGTMAGARVLSQDDSPPNLEESVHQDLLPGASSETPSQSSQGLTHLIAV